VKLQKKQMFLKKRFIKIDKKLKETIWNKEITDRAPWGVTGESTQKNNHLQEIS
jgi:hypothetical protein